MSSVGGVTIDTKVLDAMIDHARDKAGGIVSKYVSIIASDTAQNAPVEFGALRNSYLSESGMVDDLNGRVQDGVEYGVFQELGTSKMPAHPHLIPAVEKHAKGFLNSFAEIFGFSGLLE